MAHSGHLKWINLSLWMDKWMNKCKNERMGEIHNLCLKELSDLQILQTTKIINFLSVD